MRKTIHSAASKGFTLIELAIVIAIIAILAAVAIPRFADTTASAECSMIRDMNAQLTSGIGIFTAAQAATPQGFDNYVTSNPPPFAGVTGTGATAQNFNISLARFGPGARPGGPNCTASPANITCPAGVFTRYAPVYQYNLGAPTFTANPTAGTPACQ